MTPLYHPGPRYLCMRCVRAYDMHYRWEWQQTPADAPPGAPRNTHQHDYDVPAGTVTRYTYKG